MNPNIVAGFVTFLAAATHAHHATSTNFTQELISVDGVIEQIRYQNPHSSILIKHTSGEDEGTYWLIETGRCDFFTNGQALKIDTLSMQRRFRTHFDKPECFLIF